LVACASYPLACWAARLGGGRISVLFPVPAGTDPSFWRPGISDMTAIQGAGVIALNGAGFSTWTTRALLPRSRTINTSAGFADRLIRTETVTHSHGGAGEHAHTAKASHTWLDCALAMEQADVLVKAMMRQMPDRTSVIATERDRLLAYLSALDARAAGIGRDAAEIAIMAAHPRYQYLAAANGPFLAALEWDAHEDPSGAQWTIVDALLAETRARLFIWQAEPSAALRDRMPAVGPSDVAFAPLANRPGDCDFLSVMAASLDRLAAGKEPLQ
jgi:zinc transport system substrate-binding protein